jgi:hypothetical protein
MPLMTGRRAVLRVQMGLRRVRDAELAASGVGPWIEGHPDRASQIGPLVQFVSDRETGPAFAIAPRITVLNHEIGHDAMDDQAIEIAPPGKRHEVVDCQWRVEHRQLDLNRSAISVDEGLRGDGRSAEPR